MQVTAWDEVSAVTPQLSMPLVLGDGERSRGMAKGRVRVIVIGFMPPTRSGNSAGIEERRRASGAGFACEREAGAGRLRRQQPS